MSFLLDTCIISESSKLSPSTKVLDWLDQQDDQNLFLSVITLAELQQGIAALEAGKKRQRLELFLQNTIEAFGDRILSVDNQIALQWGKLRSQMEDQGRPVPVVDGFLAATALVHNLTFVTRNVSDVELTGVQIFNPWNP